jgi:diguanylate cyclase (GGDEF)-like protein
MGQKTWFAGCILLFLILAIVLPAHGQEFETEVVGVERGDLLAIHHQGKKVELDLYGVKCPAPGEPRGNEARQFTLRMVLNRDVRVRVQERENESRIAGFVLLPDGTVLNHRLVQNGLASWDRQNAPNDIKLQSLEDSARNLHLGIWSSAAPEAERIPVEGSPRDVTSRPSKALPWSSLLSTVLALLAASAMALFFARKFQRARNEESALTRPVRKQAPPGNQQTEEAAEAVESGRHAIQDLLRSLSDFVSTLVESNLSYDTKMKDHKVSIDQAMTMAGLEEIKRLLVHEIEDMQSTSEDYRRQLEHANTTIRDQQEILERFRIDSKMDFLTKIANRRAFETRLTEEFERAKRYSSVFTLIMIDIDHFKRVNDVHGHIAGDQILRLVAQVLEDQTRFNDFVSRYGGEEFVVLLPESKADQGRYVAEKIRRAVENTSFMNADEKIKVTVSAGVGEVVAESDTPETFVDRVDAALYEAKKNGRNRVEMAAD